MALGQDRLKADHPRGFLLAALTYYPLYSALGRAADPANTNYPLAILIVAIIVSYVGMVYGPIGAFLAEYFPARIRYTALIYPIVVPAVCFLLGLWLMPETRKISIWQPAEVRAPGARSWVLGAGC